MNRIPVGKTIGYAYGFTFGHLGTIIGIAWLPLVLIGVLQFLPYAFGGNPMLPAEDATAAGRQALEGLATSLLTLLLYSIIYVPVTQHALGLRHGTPIVHLALGAPELRVMGAIILFIVVFIGMVLGVAVLAGILGLVGAATGKAAIFGLIAALVFLAAFFGFIYAIVRLSFLLVPVTVAEGHISLTRGWLLTRGNFWRIFVVLLAIVVPILLLHLAGMLAIVGPGLFAPLPAGAEAAGRAFSQRFAVLGQHMPVYIGLNLILAPFGIGLGQGAAAFAYRSLVPPPG